MKKFYYILIVFTIVITSCNESANVRVQNDVHNVMLESINYGNYSITYSLYPGETSSKALISDSKDNWPKVGQIEFFMVRDGNRVYLKTKSSYNLNIDDNLLIIIADTTEVVSPLEKKSGILEVFK